MKSRAPRRRRKNWDGGQAFGAGDATAIQDKRRAGLFFVDRSAHDQECIDYARECIRLADQRPSASGLASHYGPRVDGHREQTKRSRAGIARLSWSASLFELAISASGQG
jgi:hypothetical protein